jgi:hypothetical protein
LACRVAGNFAHGACWPWAMGVVKCPIDLVRARRPSDSGESRHCGLWGRPVLRGRHHDAWALGKAVPKEQCGPGERLSQGGWQTQRRGRRPAAGHTPVGPPVRRQGG